MNEYCGKNSQISSLARLCLEKSITVAAYLSSEIIYMNKNLVDEYFRDETGPITLEQITTKVVHSIALGEKRIVKIACDP